MEIILYCLLAFTTSAILTWLTRLYAIKKAILDIPNERSSHQIPTPRGGGLAIAITFSTMLVWLGWMHFLEPKVVIGLVGGGASLAVIGYCDDVYTVRASWRVLVHFFSAIWAVYFLGHFQHSNLSLISEICYYLVAILGITWCINFYNFMDGIDGIASSQGIFMALTAGVALTSLGIYNLSLVMWLFAAIIIGFAIWNWPPAKIFLGDVGSGYLGFMFSAFGFYTTEEKLIPLSFWMLIFTIFLCDATFTLIYRLHKGNRWDIPHKEHAYQHLVSYGATHKQVTMSILGLNCFVIFPAALAILHWPSRSLMILIVTFTSFLLMWKWIKSLEILPQDLSNA